MFLKILESGYRKVTLLLGMRLHRCRKKVCVCVCVCTLKKWKVGRHCMKTVIYYTTQYVIGGQTPSDELLWYDATMSGVSPCTVRYGVGHLVM